MNNRVCTAVHNTLKPIGQSSLLIKDYPCSCDVHVDRLFLLPFINDYNNNYNNYNYMGYHYKIITFESLYLPNGKHN